MSRIAWAACLAILLYDCCDKAREKLLSWRQDADNMLDDPEKSEEQEPQFVLQTARRSRVWLDIDATLEDLRGDYSSDRAA